MQVNSKKEKSGIEGKSGNFANNIETKFVPGRPSVLDTFQRLHMDEGHTIVLITHEPYVAEHAERIIHIRDGQIMSDEKVKNRRIVNHNHPIT